MTKTHRLGFVLAGLLIVTAPVAAVGQGCRPCAGLTTTDAIAIVSLLETQPSLEDESVLYLRVPVDAQRPADESVAALGASNARPWLAFEFHTPTPLFDHLDELEAELGELARLSRLAGPRAHV